MAASFGSGSVCGPGRRARLSPAAAAPVSRAGPRPPGTARPAPSLERDIDKGSRQRLGIESGPREDLTSMANSPRPRHDRLPIQAGAEGNDVGRKGPQACDVFFRSRPGHHAC
ncbi:hypothetical protein CDD83_537 [Cordyceps sp. RAO-2017]|nr:hypothetical protein CDD83_537 [Cordyceps sp. RAO-2017]